MGRRWAILTTVLLGGCEADGTVNNRDVILASTIRVSLNGAGLEASGPAGSIHLSANGRRVVFHSSAANLHPEDTDSFLDVYVKDLDTGALILASRADGAAGAKGTGGDAQAPRISGDGRRVVFHTTRQLDPADNNNFVNDIYLRDLETDETRLLSRSTAGVKGNGESLSADISHDGSRVVFTSYANNLSGLDGDSNQDVYLREVDGNQTELVCVSTAGVKGNGQSRDARVSADGSRVSFVSQASNLVIPGPVDGNDQVYVRDRLAMTTRLVSRADGAGGAISNGANFLPVISADGRFVAYSSSAVNLHPEDVGSTPDVYVREIDADVTEIASRASGAGGALSGFGCGNPSLSGDGRFVGFSTFAANLGVDDENGVDDIYVRDRARSLTIRGSVRTFGGELNSASRESVFSADGRSLGFVSFATNAVDGDGNSASDVFVRSPFR